MNSEIFDGLPATFLPCHPAPLPDQHHIIQVYDSEFTFMDSLECFATCGLRGGEAVVLFATPRHLQDLQIRLHSSHLQLDRASWQDRYIPVVANEVLGKFMVDGWPDERMFKSVVGEFLDRAQDGGREVRVFGEIVGLLMANGETEATMRVEQLWNEICRERKLTLFCAYPRACFPTDSSGTLERICNQHGWILDVPAADPRRSASDEPPHLHGAKSAAAWSIPGTRHSETGTRWILRSAH